MNAMTQTSTPSRQFLLGAVVMLLALLLLAGVAGQAKADVPAAGDFSASIWSDKADYAPGETVRLSGANWQAGESVHIRVNDDAGSTWSHDVDVTADDAGAISDSFELPGWFVAEYSVTATGASGSMTTYSFTDANLKVAGTFTGSTTDSFTLSYKRWSGNNCTGSIRANDPLTGVVSTADFTVPQSGQNSVTLTAPSTSAGGRPFINWKDSSGTVVSPDATVCLDFPPGGTEKTYTASYGSANSAPTVAANNASVNVTEGQTAANSGTYSDTNTGDNVAITASRGTVTKTGTNSGSWSWSFATTDGPDQTGPVTITANDGNGGTATTNFTLNVANVAPTVTLAAGNPTSVNEGSTEQTYSYTISDPGADPVQSVSTSCGANGSKVGGSDTNTNTTGAFKCTFADGPSASVVSASATDADGAAGNLATQSVTINNVAPTVSVSGPATADEGSTKTYTFTVTDPGMDTFAVDAGYPDCDAGASDNGTFVAGSLSLTASGGSFQCLFANGPSTANVKMGVRDSDGAADSSTQNVQIVAVANVNPTVTAAANQSANEGASTSISLGSFSDPGPDSPWAVDVDWGDGSSHASFNMSLTGSLGSLNHTYADGPATRTVSVKVTDKNGGSDTKTFTVSVANVAPKVTLSSGNDLSLNEGSSHTYSYSINDPGVDTVDSVDTSCGDDGTKVAGSDTNTNSSGSFECSFPDGPASSTVSARATDSDGAQGAADTQTVSVANVAPTVALATGNDLSVDEGSTQQTYGYTISDPGADTVSSVTTSCGANGTKIAGSDTNTNTTGAFKCTLADGPSTSVVSATATDSDGAAGNLATQSVTVNNVAPTVSVTGPATANEGDTKTYSFSVTDPGQDTWTVDAGYPDCDAGASNNGTFVDGSLSVNASGGSFQCFFADGPSSANVKMGVRDSDGAADSSTQNVQIVQVANVDPTVTAPANQSANEGASASISLGSFTDPGPDSPWAVDVDWGDGSSHASFNMTLTGSLGALNHTYADGATTRTVSVTVTDKNGGSDTKSFTVAVANVAPKVTLSAANDLSVNEGSAHSYSYTINDPGEDTVASVDTSCGDNGVKVGSESNTNASGSFECRFPDGPSSSSVSASATDSDGDTGAADTQSVAVANVAPTVHLTGLANVDEGSTHTYSFTVSDPGVDGFDPASGFPDCDADATDNGTLVAGSYAATAGGGSFKCFFADGPATANVKMKVADSDGASGADSESVQVVNVANVAPTVTAAADQSANEGASKSFALGSFSDPGPDAPWAVDVDWGDGSTHATFDATSTGSLGSQSHTYADGPATRTVSVKVTDNYGDRDTKSFTVAVANVAPKVTLSAANDLSVNEGTTHTYSYTINDQGEDTVQSVQTSCGGNGSKVAGSDTNTNGSGSFGCSFPDGPASSTVSASATDSDGDTGAADTESVTINNVAPTADLGNNGPKPEGSAVTVSFSNAADPSSGDTAASFHYGFACTASTALPASYAAAVDGASKTCTFADNGTSVVKGRIFDRDGGYRTYDTTVTVTNVGPTITSFTGTNSLAGPLVFGPSTFKTDFTDPGTVDTHKADFTWSSGLPATQPVSPFTTGQKVDHTFAAGCNRTATVKVTDKDGDSDTKSTSVNVGTGTWLPPLADQPVSDKLKNGQVLPVKVKIADCNGVSVSGLAPVIQLVKGDQTAVNDDSAQLITITSVSAADTGTTMRESSGTYMYNLRVSVAQSDLNQDFTIVIYPYGTGTPQTLRHVIVPVK